MLDFWSLVCYNSSMKNTKTDITIKEAFDILIKQMEGGAAHRGFRAENVSLCKADDNFAAFVMETAKSVVKFNKFNNKGAK